MTKREQIEKRDALIRRFLERNIFPSWTWERLTSEEKTTFEKLIVNFPLAGTEAKRWEILNRVYHAFLKGTGYKPTGWREPEEIPLF